MPVDPNKKKQIGAYIPVSVYNDLSAFARNEDRSNAYIVDLLAKLYVVLCPLLKKSGYRTHKEICDAIQTIVTNYLENTKEPPGRD